jgi:hypothetical protein
MEDDSVCDGEWEEETEADSEFVGVCEMEIDLVSELEDEIVWDWLEDCDGEELSVSVLDADDDFVEDFVYETRVLETVSVTVFFESDCEDEAETETDEVAEGVTDAECVPLALMDVDDEEEGEDDFELDEESVSLWESVLDLLIVGVVDQIVCEAVNVAVVVEEAVMVSVWLGVSVEVPVRVSVIVFDSVGDFDLEREEVSDAVGVDVFGGEIETESVSDDESDFEAEEEEADSESVAVSVPVDETVSLVAVEDSENDSVAEKVSVDVFVQFVELVEFVEFPEQEASTPFEIWKMEITLKK